VVTALKAQHEKVLYWRGISKDKFGMPPPADKLQPDNLPAILHWAEKIDPDLCKEVEALESKVAKAERLIVEFLNQPATFRQESLMRETYQLLDEALPRLSNVIPKFEAFEKKP
jgi:hypothetical protein